MYPGDDGIATPSASADATNTASSGVESIPDRPGDEVHGDGAERPGDDAQPEPDRGATPADRLAQHLDRVADDPADPTAVAAVALARPRVPAREDQRDGEQHETSTAPTTMSLEPRRCRHRLDADRRGRARA